jgi:C1A family cysteine protease
MKLILAVLFVFLATALAANDDRRFKAHRMPHEVRFQEWMGKHGKQYTSQKEYETRLNNFIETTKRIAALNARSKALNSTATFAHNKFSDLSLSEFSVRLGMKGYKPKQIVGVPVAAPQTQAPSSFDWRARGGITAVKDQAQCGSCWAFSCTESIESAYMIKGGKKNQAPLAPQQIVDCDQVDQGCNGGDLPTCYQYVQSAGGLETNANYPYQGVDGTCNAQSGLEQDPITGFTYVIPQGSTDENTMASFLAANQPMSIIVDASSWSSYSGGILTADQCGQNLDHAVQAVGYQGLDTNGYWIVRNSWGADWGENGFIRLQFASNTCGLTSEVTVPNI